MRLLNERKDRQGFCHTTVLLLWSCSIEKRALLVGLVDRHFYPAHNFIERIMKLIGNSIHWSNPYLLSHHSQLMIPWLHPQQFLIYVIFRCYCCLSVSYSVIVFVEWKLTCISSYDKSVCINTIGLAISLFTYLANFVVPFL